MRRHLTLIFWAALLAWLAFTAAGGRLPKLPTDHVFPASADSPGRATFSHASHVDEARPSCTSCHPRLFRILARGTPAGAARVTHEEMEAGRQCGACHNGRDATGLDECESCHRSR